MVSIVYYNIAVISVHTLSVDLCNAHLVYAVIHSNCYQYKAVLVILSIEYTIVS